MTSEFLSDKSCIYAGNDPQAFSDYLNQNFGPFTLRWRVPVTTNATIHYRQLGRIGLCRLRYGAPTGVASLGISDLFLVQFILSGTGFYTTGGQTVEVRAGEVIVLNPGVPLELSYSEDCEKFILAIPASLLHDVCQDHRWQVPQAGLRFACLPRPADDLQNLRQLVGLMCEEAESLGATAPMLNHYNWIVAAKLLNVLEHNVCTECLPLQSSTFERLVCFIDENIKSEITLDDLANHANMSHRSVYLLFEKHAKMTPKNYIRQKKLEGVYAELMDPACRVANITAVALDYGFNHLGRFSEFYKSTFGVLPSDSLRKRQLKVN